MSSGTAPPGSAATSSGLRPATASTPVSHINQDSSPISTTSGTIAFAARGGADDSSGISTLTAASDPGFNTPSPRAARRSAFNIGPKSRPRKATAATKASRKIG